MSSADSGPTRSRREFLRLALLGAVGAACGGSTSKRPPAAATTGSPSPAPASSPTPRGLAWHRLDARGPSARRDHSFTGDDAGRAAYLFGGRSDDGSLGDLWIYDAQGGRWSKGPGGGPSPRFGHAAAFIGGRLLIFAGQGGPASFFNDLWSFDPASARWTRVATPGAAPAKRYGVGAAQAGDALLVTHGFTDTGRFDDTWSYATSWRKIAAARPPVKRCLHRFVHMPGSGRAVLFGGQTDGTPFLGDTWTFDAAMGRWTEVRGAAPSARNVYAAVAAGATLYLFGGKAEAGPQNDVWTFDGAAWKRASPSGTAPAPRGGIDGARVGESMLVFGGSGASGDLDDLWELSLPAA